MNDYKVYKSKTILENHAEFVKLCEELNDKLHEELSIDEGESTTWEYYRYNIFNMKKGDKLFDSLREELVAIIADYSTGEPCWVQSWLNFDTYETVQDVLGEHDHLWDFHGYISIDPKNTKTVFPYHNYEVVNEIGNIYIGPGYRKHKVVNLSEYTGNRITFGYDVTYEHPKTQSYRWFRVN